MKQKKLRKELRLNKDCLYLLVILKFSIVKVNILFDQSVFSSNNTKGPTLKYKCNLSHCNPFPHEFLNLKGFFIMSFLLYISTLNTVVLFFNGNIHRDNFFYKGKIYNIN